jgi:hypothetical protein
MTQRRTGAGLNVGPQTAPSLGANDPRSRRAPESAKTPELTVAAPLYIDSRGRLAIRLGPGLEVDSSGTLRLTAT